MVMEESVCSSQRNVREILKKMSHALRYELREPVAKAEPNKSLK